MLPCMMQRRVFLSSAVAFAAAPALAATSEAEAFVYTLAAPRTHAIMRHALAPGGGDPAEFRLDDPSTQRRLSDAGRAQARAIGTALRQAGARFDRVLTSQWDRCRETAELLDLGPVTDLSALNSFFGNRDRGPAQTEALRATLMALPPKETLMLVTHQVNITAFTGVFPSSGEVVAATARAEGQADIRATFLIRP
jgi:phosphohistidine phosphatase SixA